MTMKAMLISMAAIAASAQIAAADVSLQGISDNLKANGFTGVDITVGPSQVRAEGYSPSGTKIDVVYDRATGKIEQQEVSHDRPDPSAPTGLHVTNGTSDFTDASSDAPEHANGANEKGMQERADHAASSHSSTHERSSAAEKSDSGSDSDGESSGSSGGHGGSAGHDGGSDGDHGGGHDGGDN